MVGRFSNNFAWSWKESYKFKQGYNKIVVTIGICKRVVPFCMAMEKEYKRSVSSR